MKEIVKEGVTIVAVSKYATVEQIQNVYDQGYRHFGESRVQEALIKQKQLPQDIQWHFIGRLQTNKVNQVVGNFCLIHSVHSLELAQLINKKSQEKGIVSNILLQVNTSGEITKQGFTPEELKNTSFQHLSHVQVQGLMTMAPLTGDESVIRSCFSLLRKMKEEFRLEHLSMGMSQDYHIAIEEGATYLRIGSKIFEVQNDS